MFELFKDSKYEGFIGDTFKFIKLYGVHLIKNYLIINSFFLITLSVFSYIYGPKGSIQFSAPLFISIFILLIILGAFNFAFMPIYFSLIDDKGGTNFGLKELVIGMKNAIGKTIKYYLYLMLWLIPFMIAVIISFITIIGIPALMLFLPFFMLWTMMAYYYYLSGEAKSVFKILGPNFRLLKKQFWPAVGTVILFLFISQLSATLIAIIPTIVHYLTSVTTSEGGGSFFETLAYQPNIVVSFFTTIISSILYLILLISMGIIYYSLRNKEVSIDAEIEQLGQ